MILRLAIQAMGTRFELVLVAGDAKRDEAHLRAAGEEALSKIEEVDRRLSLFRRDSLLAHLNRTAVSRPVSLDADTSDLFMLCDRVHRASGGAFDPTIAPLMRAHGLHDDSSPVPLLEPSEAREHVGWESVLLDPAGPDVRFADPTWIDLGGVAKGHGLDLAARSLREAGVQRALLHGGTSTVVALGAAPGEEAWTVAVGSGSEAPIARLRDACLSVSAPDGREVSRDGRRISHVLDPRTGKAANHGVRTAAVATSLSSGAALADAWSTALLVAGEELPHLPELETLFASGSETAPVWIHQAPAEPCFTRIPCPTTSP